MNGPAPRAAQDLPFVAVFDLDGTITWHDTLLPYLLGYLAYRPARILRLWRVPVALGAYLINRDRGLLKSRMLRSVMGGETRATVDAWSNRYVADLDRRRVFRPMALAALEAHRKSRDHLVLLSASPDLYVPRIGRLLGFEHTLCTEMRWGATGSPADVFDGELRRANRRGEEKCRSIEWLRAQYPGKLVVAYGNSDSDLPHLMRADRALLVNAGFLARRHAAAAGIPVADWK